MKIIILLFFMIIVGITAFADYDGFSDEFCKTGLENNGRYDFDVSNFQIDLDGDKKIEDTSYLKYELYQYKVGDTVKVTYIRNGEQKTTNIT